MQMTEVSILLALLAVLLWTLSPQNRPRRTTASAIIRPADQEGVGIT